VVKGISERKKRYVEVVAVHDTDGSVTPKAIRWSDGRTFRIDQVLDVQRRASLKVGGFGLRYLIRIGHHQSFLFYEEPKWFVEEIVRESSPPLPG
jgi:hypothetical protein